MPRLKVLTPMCLVTLQVIIRYRNQHRFSPSIREVATMLDEFRPTDSDELTSTSTVSYQIQKLIEMGYMVGEENIARGFAPTESGERIAQEIIQEGHVYRCGVCNVLWLWTQVRRNANFALCPADGNIVLDVTHSKRGQEFLRYYNADQH